MMSTLQEKNEDMARTAGIMGKTRRNNVRDEKGQERQEERARKEVRARNGGRQDKTTVKKGQEQDEETCTNMKKGQ